LDFTSFVLSNPANGVAISFALLNGSPSPQAGAGGLFYTINGQCNTDSFSVSSPGSVGSPEICGVNTGDHSKSFCVSILANQIKHKSVSDGYGNTGCGEI
jgi:hypothetical protein